MDYDTVAPPVIGHALTAVSVNLLCRDVLREADFLSRVFGLTVHRASADFAILLHAGQPIQLHSDGTFANHPLHGLLPESGTRGAGIELRLHEADPDAAFARMEGETGGMVLDPPRNRTPHGLREAVILSPEGYAWVPSRRI